MHVIFDEFMPKVLHNNRKSCDCTVSSSTHNHGLLLGEIDHLFTSLTSEKFGDQKRVYKMSAILSERRGGWKAPHSVFPKIVVIYGCFSNRVFFFFFCVSRLFQKKLLFR